MYVINKCSDCRLCFIKKQSNRDCKDSIERFMNEENDCDHSVEGNAVGGPVDRVSKEVVERVKK